MLMYFVVGMVVAAVLAYGAYYVLQVQVLTERLSLDDGKGYYLISCIVSGFLISAGFFWLGQSFGYDQQEHSSTMMALSLLLNIMVTLLVLIYGLVRFHEPEHY